MANSRRFIMDGSVSATCRARNAVRKVHPGAKAARVGGGFAFEVYSDGIRLGAGRSEGAAWLAAERNLKGGGVAK